MNLVWKPKNVGFRWRWFDTVDAKLYNFGFFSGIGSYCWGLCFLILFGR